MDSNGGRHVPLVSITRLPQKSLIICHAMMYNLIERRSVPASWLVTHDMSCPPVMPTICPLSNGRLSFLVTELPSQSNHNNTQSIFSRENKISDYIPIRCNAVMDARHRNPNASTSVGPCRSAEYSNRIFKFQ